MPNLSVRDLAKGGIVTDYDQTQLPLGFWTNGRNIEFVNGKSRRAPIWRLIADGVAKPPVTTPAPAIIEPLTMASPVYDTTTPKFGGAALSGGAGALSETLLPTPPFTIEAWIKTSTTAKAMTALGASNVAAIGTDASGHATATVYDFNYTAYPLTSSVTLTDGVWHHVVLSVSPTTQVLYVDGVPASTISVANISVYGLTGNFGVGLGCVTSTTWTGEVDEVAVWNGIRYPGAFTPPSAPYAGTEPLLMGLWHLNSNGTNAVVAPQAVGSPVAEFVAARTPAGGFDEAIICCSDGSLVRYVDGVLLPASEPGFTPRADSALPWTTCQLGDVVYVNRGDGPLRAFLPGSANAEIDPQWESDWTTLVVRPFNAGIVALNVTKGATALQTTPTMVKVSDITFYGETTRSWNSNNPTALAYENPLSQLDGAILDGMALGNSFLFYTANQTWIMSVGGIDDYSFQKLYDNSGIINTNCVVEVNGIHYVFGSHDIYATDGAGLPQSLADGKVKEYIYSTLDRSAVNRFFVQYVPDTNSIKFCYVSADPDCQWQGTGGCNNAAIYNLSSNTWTFSDLPNVYGMALINVNSVLTWANAPSTTTWANVGGSWFSQTSSRDQHVVAVNQPFAASTNSAVVPGNCQLLGYDRISSGSMAFPLAEGTFAPAFVEREGICLDTPDMGQAPLTVAKEVRAVFPEITVTNDATVDITLGEQMTPSGAVTWDAALSYDPSTDYKVDSRMNGRFLAIRFDFPSYAEGEVSGFDIDVVSNGRR